MSGASSIYRLFKRGDGRDDGTAAPVRPLVIGMVALTCALTGVGVTRVGRQHEVLRLGYLLSRESDQTRELRETRRKLEIERATLTAPDRIRRLATQLGMTTVAPDRIRILEVPARPPATAAADAPAATTARDHGGT